MQPAQFHPSCSPILPHAASNISAAQSSHGGTIYAQVQPWLPQQAIHDRTVMRYQNETAQVFPHRLVRVPERFGLPESAELKQLGVTQACVANATVLPPDGMAGSSMVLGAPGDELSKAGTKERVARFGAALLSQSVAHIVCVNHSSTEAAAHLPIGKKLQLPAQGGPLEMTFSPSSMNHDGNTQFRIEAKLPSGGAETSGDMGVWALNLGEASVEDIQGTLRSLYQQSEGQNVAFCCQSGNSRSGAAAVLFQQRKAAEDAFKRGEIPKAAELISGAQSWEKECKAVRSSAFAGKMRQGLLEAHAQVLVDEIHARLAGKPKQAPAVSAKPVLPVKPEKKLQGQPASEGHATSPMTTRKNVAPEPAPKPGARPTPTPRYRLVSEDTASITSELSHASSTNDDTFSLDSGGQAFDRLQRGKPSVDPSSLQSPYNKGPEQLAGSAADAVNRGNDRPQQGRATATESPAPRGADADPLYSKPWDLLTRAPRPEMREHQTGAERLRQSFRKVSTIVERMTRQAASGPTSVENHYSLSLEDGAAMPASHRSLNSWQLGSHAQSRDLQSYLRGLTQTFTQEAKQGFNPFAAKSTYGVGRAIEAVKKEAGNAHWNDLAEALETTMSEADDTQEGMTFLVLTAVMKQRLSEEFSTLDPKLQETWRRRTGKDDLGSAMKTLQTQLAELQKQLDSNATSENQLLSQLRALNLTLLSFKALHEVGQDPMSKP